MTINNNALTMLSSSLLWTVLFSVLFLLQWVSCSSSNSSSVGEGEHGGDKNKGGKYGPSVGGDGSLMLIRQERNILCNDFSPDDLAKILGPAFNPRYMSLEAPPPVSTEDDELDGNQKRKAGMMPSFYVDEGYTQVMGEDPAWSANHLKFYEGNDYEEQHHHHEHRKKRAVIKPLRQWQCESQIRWIDLGVDYFPRYLRTVECTSSKCWYGHFRCKAKSFTVKLLKRRRGRCIKSSPGTKVGFKGLPTDLRQLWVWEERAVNFCCECASD